MKALNRITGVICKDRVTNEAILELTGLGDLYKPHCGHGYDGLLFWPKRN